MGAISEYIHLIPSLEVYPRIFYYHKRYTDILGKLKKIKCKYPKLFENERHDIFKSSFDHGVEVKVFGESDVHPVHFIPVESELYHVVECRHEAKGDQFYVDNIVAVEPVHRYTRTGYSSETKTDNKAIGSPITVGEASVIVTICHVSIERLDEDGLDKVTQHLRQASYKSSGKHHDCFLLCRTHHQFTQTEKDTFTRQIRHNIGTLLPLYGIVIGTDNVSIKNEIGMFLESECIRRFIYLRNILQEFTKGQRKHYTTKPLLETKTVTRQIKRFLLNVCDVAIYETESDVEEKLSNVVKCITVNALSEKYNLQVWVCNGIVNADTFQNNLELSFSKNTRHRLKKILSIAENPGMVHNVPIETVMNVYTKHIVRNLQKESCCLFPDVEKSLSQFVCAVRKMLLEINCCLKQSSVTQLLDETHNERTLPVLDVDLRKDILSIHGVYGVGTVYGQLEVHANPDSDISDVQSSIRKLMRSKSRVVDFAVRALDSKPEIYVDCQYENGETIESLDPVRKGTLGCFINGSDNRLYGLTCAHVVKSHCGQENNVFIKDRLNRQCLFAKSYPNLTVSTGEDEKPLIDLAAVRILEHMTDKCIKFLKDDNGRIKPAVLAADRPSDLVGMYVYKHGAMSGLTKGIVCSDDYSILNDEDDEIEYIMLIDNYDDDDGHLFAIPGDSGSTICVPDRNEVNIIKTVGVLSAGKFKPAGLDMPLYFSFRLYDGLRKLTSKAGGLQFNFPQI